MRIAILLVDDDKDALDSIKNGLEKYGFEVDTYTNPVKALEDFQPNKYEHILLDMRMPKMNGLDLYHEIKKRDANAKIIVMTGPPVNPNKFKMIFPELGRKIGTPDKPFTVSKLLELINN